MKPLVLSSSLPLSDWSYLLQSNSIGPSGNQMFKMPFFMVQPRGYMDPIFPNHVCKLKKSLYGLKQAPRAWFKRFSSHLPHLEFLASVADSSFFILRHKRFLVYLMVYVNDIVLTSNFRSFLQSLIHQLSAEFELKDLGPPLFPWVIDYKIYKRPFSHSDQVCSWSSSKEQYAFCQAC